MEDDADEFAYQFEMFKEELKDSLKMRPDYDGWIEALKDILSPAEYIPSQILLLFLEKFPDIINDIQQEMSIKPLNYTLSLDS